MKHNLKYFTFMWEYHKKNTLWNSDPGFEFRVTKSYGKVNPDFWIWWSAIFCLQVILSWNFSNIYYLLRIISTASGKTHKFYYTLLNRFSGFFSDRYKDISKNKNWHFQILNKYSNPERVWIDSVYRKVFCDYSVKYCFGITFGIYWSEYNDFMFLGDFIRSLQKNKTLTLHFKDMSNLTRNTSRFVQSQTPINSVRPFQQNHNRVKLHLLYVFPITPLFFLWTSSPTQTYTSS